MSDTASALAAPVIRLGWRTPDRVAEHRLRTHGTPDLLARLLAARGVRDPEDADVRLAGLLPPDGLLGIDACCELLGDAIDAQAPILVVGDYDCDGATAIAVAVRGLRALGAHVDWLVPRRLETGYGLTPEVVAQALEHPRLGLPEVLVTVDNGIAAHEGIAAAQAHGMTVVVTDHHLPGSTLPPAEAILNPNQPDCTFASKHIAGVGVMFYLLMALRAHRRTQGHYQDQPEPALAPLLDLVALGTVADVVRLDRNNRILVTEGLRRIRAGKAHCGINALLQVAGREARRCSSTDLGFLVGPRLNAAGRLADMGVGVECLLTDDFAEAQERATQLDTLNRERRQIEQQMREQAEAQLPQLPADRHGVVLYAADWHQGVVGLVASRVKEQCHRPCLALAPVDPADPQWLRGSGRSIPGVHLRDVLDRVDRLHPGLLERFGGHAMAAGLTTHIRHLPLLETAFDEAVQELADPECWVPEVLTDGPLEPAHLVPATAALLETQVWGQGFPPPLFSGRFQVVWQRVVGTGHLKLQLLPADAQARAPGQPPPTRLDAMCFGRTEAVPDQVLLAYQLQQDHWQGRERLTLVVRHVFTPGEAPGTPRIP